MASILQHKKVKWHVDIVAFVTETFRLLQPHASSLSYSFSTSWLKCCWLEILRNWSWRTNDETFHPIMWQVLGKGKWPAKIQNVKMSLKIYFSQHDKEAAGSWEILIMHSTQTSKLSRRLSSLSLCSYSVAPAAPKLKTKLKTRRRMMRFCVRPH